MAFEFRYSFKLFPNSGPATFVEAPGRGRRTGEGMSDQLAEALAYPRHHAAEGNEKGIALCLCVGAESMFALACMSCPAKIVQAK
jgi:hypothetical protein